MTNLEDLIGQSIMVFEGQEVYYPSGVEQVNPVVYYANNNRRFYSLTGIPAEKRGDWPEAIVDTITGINEVVKNNEGKFTLHGNCIAFIYDGDMFVTPYTAERFSLCRRVFWEGNFYVPFSTVCSYPLKCNYWKELLSPEERKRMFWNFKNDGLM